MRLRELQDAGKSRKAIAEEAKLSGSDKSRAAKMTKLLGAKKGTSGPKGIDAEAARATIQDMAGEGETRKQLQGSR